MLMWSLTPPFRDDRSEVLREDLHRCRHSNVTLSHCQSLLHYDWLQVVTMKGLVRRFCFENFVDFWMFSNRHRSIRFQALPHAMHLVHTSQTLNASAELSYLFLELGYAVLHRCRLHKYFQNFVHLKEANRTQFTHPLPPS